MTTLPVLNEYRVDPGASSEGDAFLPQSTSPSLQPHFMLVPSLACQAECSYCFGPHQRPLMSPQTLDAALDFMVKIADESGQRKVKVTFHGGEPLLAGHALFRHALEGLRRRFGREAYEVGVQSNLWLLDDEFCRLFREHPVEIGTSLDGPEEITDYQRGRGYFAKTMQGIRKARSNGMAVGCIATFTSWSVSRWREVFDFFLAERLNFSIHAAVPPLGSQDGQFSMAADQYGSMLEEMLDFYVEHRREISISSLDQMCQGFGCGAGKVCTFRHCLGSFLVIDPSGDIDPCQRFCGTPMYRLGQLGDQPSLARLMKSAGAKRMAERQGKVRAECAGCHHLDYCKGGCPYNAWAGGNGHRVKDPYCEAYRRTFDHISGRVFEEMRSEENVEAVARRPYSGSGNPLLRKGPLIELVREGRHPSEIARTAKRIVAAVELARGPDIPSVASRLVHTGISRSQASGEASLVALQRTLHPKSGVLNSLYLHVTFRCQLSCTHCYARADLHGHHQPDMPVEAVARIVREARDAGFRQLVITGGEPLLHRGDLLAQLAELRPGAVPMNLVLRTNFAGPLRRDELHRVAHAVDRIVVSVDGNQQSHDARRGPGTYAATTRNLEAYTKLVAVLERPGRGTSGSQSGQRAPLVCLESNGTRLLPAELSLACVLASADVKGEAGHAVRQLAVRLGIHRATFRPLLPLGRVQDWPEPPVFEASESYAEPMELIEEGFYPVSSCGLGQNLYVDPGGDAFPCYAQCGLTAYMGNVVESGLNRVLESTRFRELTEHNVDTDPKCRSCEVRYLCGGGCLAWRGERTGRDLDTPPSVCTAIQACARLLFHAAQERLTD